MATPRLIIVDDTSPSIQYSAGSSWFLDDSGSHDQQGILGPVFNKTLHGTVENATFSFAYNGSSLSVYGTNLIRNDTGTPDPQWECSIDGILLHSSSSTVAVNNWVLCDTSQSPFLETVGGPHVLTVKVTVRQSQPFWLDTIRYTPSANVPLDGKAVIVDNNDPALQYGPGWGAWGGGANFTEQAGSTLTFPFIGVSLGWFAYLATERPHVATTGTYSVDGEPPTNFSIGAIPDSNGATLYNQQLFNTRALDFGSHLLHVSFLGNSQTTSLILDYLVVQNGTAVADQTTTTNIGQASPNNQATTTTADPSTAITSSTTNTTNTTSTTSTANAIGTAHISSNAGWNNIHNHLGALIGGGVTGLIVILGLLVALLVYRRRKQKRREEYERPRNFTAIIDASDMIRGEPSDRHSIKYASPLSKYPLSPGISLDAEGVFIPSSKRIPLVGERLMSTFPSNEKSGRLHVLSRPAQRPPAHTHPDVTSQPGTLVHEVGVIKDTSLQVPRTEVPPPYTRG